MSRFKEKRVFASNEVREKASLEAAEYWRIQEKAAAKAAAFFAVKADIYKLQQKPSRYRTDSENQRLAKLKLEAADLSFDYYELLEGRKSLVDTCQDAGMSKNWAATLLWRGRFFTDYRVPPKA